MKVYKIKNWRKHQSYEGRVPSWIKLFRDLLNPVKQPKYAALSDIAKLHLVHIWLLAAECDGQVPEQWVSSKQLNVNGKVRIEELISSGFVDVMTHVTEDVMTRVTASVSDSDSDSPSFDQENGFSLVWRDIIAAKIPKPVRKAQAEKHFRASVKSESDMAELHVALEKYRASDRVKRGFVMDGSRFLHEWRDWVNYDETVTPTHDRTSRDVLLDKRDAWIAAHGKPTTPHEQRWFMAEVGYDLSTVQEYALSADGNESIEDWLKRKGAA